MEEIQENNIENDTKKEKTKKRGIGKKILIILGIILIIFVIYVVRNIIIISKIQNKALKYADCKNYYAIIYNYSGKTMNTAETYVKDDKSKTVINIYGIGSKRRLVNYTNGTLTNTYIENNEEKIALPNSNGLPSKLELMNPLYYSNTWQLILMSATTIITEKECNGVDCYCVNNWLYISKDTGLIVRMFSGSVNYDEGTIDIIDDYQYKFDCVTDEDFVEPDVNQYKIVEN